MSVASTALAPRITRRARRLVISVAVAVGIAVSLGSAASADAAQFSPFVPVKWSVGFLDCAITSGPVRDPGATMANYRVIGGGHVTCNSYHNYITVTVGVWAYDPVHGGSWQPRPGFSHTYYASNGFGPIAGGGYANIQTLNIGCQNRRGYQFSTSVYVTIDGRSSGWINSPWSVRQWDGC
jgi:hypothetical protein